MGSGHTSSIDEHRVCGQVTKSPGHEMRAETRNPVCVVIVIINTNSAVCVCACLIVIIMFYPDVLIIYCTAPPLRVRTQDQRDDCAPHHTAPTRWTTSETRRDETRAHRVTSDLVGVVSSHPTGEIRRDRTAAPHPTALYYSTLCHHTTIR